MPNLSPTDQLKIIADNINAVVYEFYQDIEGHFGVSYMSEGAVELYGYKPELIYENINLIFDLIHEEDRDAFLQSVSKSYELNQNWFHDARIIVNGQLKWVSGRSKILKSKDGSCKWFGVIMDVTEQYVSDNLIKEQRHDLDTILSVISPIIKLKISHVNDIKIISMSPGISQLFPFINLDSNPFDLMRSYLVEGERDQFDKKLSECLSNEETFSFSFRIKLTDDIRYIMMSGISIKMTDHVELFAKFIDITTEKRLEMENTKLSMELIQLMDTANTPCFGVDLNRNINEWNQKFSDITGYVKSDVIGCPIDSISSFILSSGLLSISKVVNDALIGIETTNHEVPITTIHGDRVMTLLSSTTRRNIDGLIVGAIFVCQDITEMENLKLQKEKFNQALMISREEERKHVSRFIHDEIAQQLASLKITLDLIDKKNESLNVKDLIDSSKNQIVSLIKSSRQIAKSLRSSQLDVLGLKSAIEDYINQLRLINDLITVESTIIGDFSTLSSVFIDNLYRISQEGLSNVFYHSKATTVVFTLSYLNFNRIILEIIDNGIGINQTNLKKENSFGIIGMKERVSSLNGAFDLIDQRPGTKLKVTFNV